MNTNQTIKQIEESLATLGFNRQADRSWRRGSGGGELEVALLEYGNPFFRATWTDGKATDTMFFELGLCEASDRQAQEHLLAWAAWYSAGNQLTVSGTLGFQLRAA